MEIEVPPTPCYSYVLRLWAESQRSEQAIWRFTLLDPRTSERCGFSAIEGLMEYLTHRIQANPPSAGQEPTITA